MARYGLRFAAAFAAVGFEDLDDLMLCCPSASVVAGVLKGAGAHISENSTAECNLDMILMQQGRGGGSGDVYR